MGMPRRTGGSCENRPGNAANSSASVESRDLRISLNMRIEHIALWTENLERFKQFYLTYFGAIAGDDYVNPAKGRFPSRFVHFVKMLMSLVHEL